MNGGCHPSAFQLSAFSIVRGSICNCLGHYSRPATQRLRTSGFNGYPGATLMTASFRISCHSLTHILFSSGAGALFLLILCLRQNQLLINIINSLLCSASM
jgi:hypothetical protein